MGTVRRVGVNRLLVAAEAEAEAEAVVMVVLAVAVVASTLMVGTTPAST